jgi:hypothetical protein
MLHASSALTVTEHEAGCTLLAPTRVELRGTDGAVFEARLVQAAPDLISGRLETKLQVPEGLTPGVYRASVDLVMVYN